MDDEDAHRTVGSWSGGTEYASESRSPDRGAPDCPAARTELRLADPRLGKPAHSLRSAVASRQSTGGAVSDRETEKLWLWAGGGNPTRAVSQPKSPLCIPR